MTGNPNYNHDNLGSTRRLRASDKSALGAYEYTPYGQAYATSGVALGSLGGAFTGKSWDATSQLYYFPYRYYSPSAARWLTRDPLGMVDGPNVYAYVKARPITVGDALGLSILSDFLGSDAAACITGIVCCYGVIDALITGGSALFYSCMGCAACLTGTAAGFPMNMFICATACAGCVTGVAGILAGLACCLVGIFEDCRECMEGGA